MTHNHSASVAELRRESERTRAELSQTVDTLRDKINDTAADIRQKVSPEHIKSEVSDYVAETSRHWFDNLKQQALDNPMQTLAAGTAIAVPAFKMMRSVPLPLLMIGAGLALSSSRVRAAVADRVSTTLQTPEGGNVVNDVTDMAREGWRTARTAAESAISDARDAVTGKVREVRDTASQIAGDAKERAAGLGDAAKANLGPKVNTVSDAARDAFDTTRNRAAETFTGARASAETLVRDNAALVAGLGLAIGALIAASLPSTQVERAALGEASDAVRNKTADAAAEKFEEAKSAAISAAEAAAGKISDAALGSELSRATQDATAKLKTVADDTITTAFEPSHSDHR